MLVIDGRSGFLTLARMCQRLKFRRSGRIQFGERAISSGPEFRKVHSVRGSGRVSGDFSRSLSRTVQLFLRVNSDTTGRITGTVRTLASGGRALTRRIVSVSFSVGHVRISLSRRVLLLITGHRPTTDSLHLIVTVDGNIISLRHVNSRTMGVTRVTVGVVTRNGARCNCTRIRRLDGRIQLVMRGTLRTFDRSGTRRTFRIVHGSGIIGSRCRSTVHTLVACVVRSSHCISGIVGVV